MASVLLESEEEAKKWNGPVRHEQMFRGGEEGLMITSHGDDLVLMVGFVAW